MELKLWKQGTFIAAVCEMELESFLAVHSLEFYEYLYLRKSYNFYPIHKLICTHLFIYYKHAYVILLQQQNQPMTAVVGFSH